MRPYMTGTLIAYRTPPQMERKALAEAREAGHRAYLPREPRTTKMGARNVPTARGYVFAEGKPADAEHIRNAIGPVSRSELRRLYVRTSKTQRRHAFTEGDTVHIKGMTVDNHGKPLLGNVVAVIRSGWYEVRFYMLSKPHVVKIRESDLAAVHPGS
jgi:hypothetical protein